MLDKISLLILWDFANDALSGFKVPNLVINLFFSLVYCIFVTTNNETKLKKVNAKADQTYSPYPFMKKFGKLNSERAAYAKSQSINKEILSNTTI